MFGLGKYSDETIIQKIKSGDEKILIYLYKDYFKLIKNFILKNSGEEDQVDDILQETIIALWRNVQKPSFLLHSKFSTYVLAITKNIWFKELKKKSKLIRIDHSNQHSLKTNTPDPPIDQSIILQLVQEMDETCHKLLSYFYFDGMNNNTIAEKLNFANSNTVKSKKYQCFKKLQQQVLKHYVKEDLL